jgi:hypothetical protein
MPISTLSDSQNLLAGYRQKIQSLWAGSQLATGTVGNTATAKRTKAPKIACRFYFILGSSK